MADNTQLSVRTGDGDIISTDAITTLNGSSITTGEKTQRVKVGWGVDATFNDTNASNPLPVVQTGTPALPTGAATAANQATEIASLASIDGKITAVNTGAVVVSSSALPTGASTSAKQDTGNTSLANIDSKITAVNTGAVTVASSALPTGAATSAKQDTGNTSLASIDSKITAVNTGAVTVSSSALPTGAATSAKQDTGNTSLSSIDGKTPALGQALSAASVPVVLPAAQITTLTPPAAITGFALDATLTGGSQKTKIVDSAGSNVATVSAAGAVKVDGSAVTQPISGTVSASNLPATVDTNSGSKSANTLRVVLATDQPALTNKLLVTPDSVALPANQSVNVSQINGVTPLMGAGNGGTGSLRVNVASDQVAIPASQSGTWTVQPGNTANATPWLVTDTPATSGGLSQSSFVGAASNNKTAVKASAGQLYFISVQNLAATPVYLKVFDKTSANVTAGTTACDYQFMIPGNTAGAGIVLNIDKGIAHANAITIMLTAGIATTDNTSVSASQQIVTIGYK